MDSKFLLQNKEPFLVKSYIEQIRKQFQDFEVVYTVEPGDFIDNVHRGTLFGEGSRIIVLNPLTEEALEPIYSVMNLESPDVFILVDDGGLSKNKFYTKVKALCKVIKVEKLEDREVEPWTDKYLRNRGLTCDPDVSTIIASRKGNNLYAIAYEIRKLEFACSDKKVSKQKCLELVSFSGEAKFFDFCNYFFRKRVKETLLELDRVSEESYIGLVHFLLSYIDKLYKIAIYKEQKMADEDICNILDLNRYIYKSKYLVALAAFGKVRLLKVTDLLNDLDLRLRLCKFDKKYLMTNFIVKCMKV